MASMCFCSSFSGKTVQDLGSDSSFPEFVDLAFYLLYELHQCIYKMEIQNYSPGLSQSCTKEKRVNHRHLEAA